MPDSRHLMMHSPLPPVVEVRPTSGHPATLLAGARGLTGRDMDVIEYLHHHRALTALQLARLVFGSYSHARSRAATLSARGILARFRQLVYPGSQPWRYTVGPVGALVYAASHDQPLPRPAQITEQVMRLAHSGHTPHRIGVNDFFATLTGHTRRYGGALTAWRPEHELAGMCATILRPDAYATYTAPPDTAPPDPAHATGRGDPGARVLDFFFEHDTGTETLSTLVDKIGRYHELATLGVAHPVLIRLPTALREQHFHAAVARRWPRRPPVPVLTLAADQLAEPGDQIAPRRPCVADALWMPVGPGTPRRLNLTALATPAHPAGSAEGAGPVGLLPVPARPTHRSA